MTLGLLLQAAVATDQSTPTGLLAKLPQWEQMLIAGGSFAVVVIGIVAKVVREFRRGRREAQEEVMQGFREDTVKVYPPPVHVPPAPLPPPPQLPADILERLSRVEVADDCRAELAEMRDQLHEANDALAAVARTLETVTRRAEKLERRCEQLQSERDDAFARLAELDTSDTDRPPPLPPPRPRRRA